jgi:hypothetical protein
LDRLAASNPTALRVLQTCAFLAPEPIPRAMLVHDRLRLNEAIRDINRYALARVDGGSNTIQLHRLVQAVLINRMTQEEQSAIRHEAHHLLTANDPRASADAEQWPRYSEFTHTYGPPTRSNATTHRSATLLST